MHLLSMRLYSILNRSPFMSPERRIASDLARAGFFNLIDAACLRVEESSTCPDPQTLNDSVAFVAKGIQVPVESSFSGVIYDL